VSLRTGSDVSATRVSEYDRFGPWIDEVQDLEDVPRLFRDHAIDFDAARLVLKVPREIARRDATADMDLYDYLLVLDAVGLTVLKRFGAGPQGGTRTSRRGYDVMTVPYEQVVATREEVNLLDGRLTIHTASGTAVSVRFNGAARETVTGLVDQLRAATAVDPLSAVGRALVAAADVLGDEAVGLEPGDSDQVFISEFDRLLRANPALVAWASYGRSALAPSTRGVRGAWVRSTHSVWPMTLNGGVLASDGRALEVLGRDKELRRGRTPDYSTSRLVVPISALDRVAVAVDPLYPDATVATLTAGQTAIDVAVPTGSTAARILTAAANALR
jgi:hypothetical protein